MNVFSDLIQNTGFINLDFADVTAIMKDAGLAHMGVGRAAGKGKAEEAAQMAISSPLLETSINGARGILINITGPMDMDFDEVDEAASLIQAAVHPDANTIFGATFDETLDDELRVTVIATGFEEKKSVESRVINVPRSGSPKDTFGQVFLKSQEEEQEKVSATDDNDPFDEILKIFNGR